MTKIFKLLSVMVSSGIILSSACGVTGVKATGVKAEPLPQTNESPYLYSPIDGGFEVVNGNKSYNRPLYGNHINDTAAGELEGVSMLTYTSDKPMTALSFQKWTRNETTQLVTCKPYKMGNLFFALKDGKWFNEFDNVTARYIYGREEYILTDSCLEGEIKITMVRSDDIEGLIVKIEAPESVKDRIIFAIGGNSSESDGYTNQGFNPDNTKNTKFEYSGQNFSLSAESEKIMNLYGFSSVPITYSLKDASSYKKSFNEFMNSTSETTPMLVGEFDKTADDIYLLFSMEKETDAEVSDYIENPPQSFTDSVNYIKGVSDTITINTPDDYLDSTMAAGTVGVDSIWHDPYITHGGTAWHKPHAGWRDRYAFSVMGWGDRVEKDAMKYKEFQGEDGRIHATADSAPGDSYNMDEVFVDQLLYNWEATGDTEFMKNGGYEMIKKHLEAKENDEKNIYVSEYNLYENFLNAWNTDNKFNNGGVGSIAGAYMWRAYNTMSKIAGILGYDDDKAFYSNKAELIKSKMKEHLWVDDNGIYAEYLDSLGEKQLHTAPDLSTIYTTVDMGITDMFESYTNIKYNENYIDRVTGLPRGGEYVYSSNWLPDYYSTRGLYPQEMINLMLSYYQTGQADEANKILKGLEQTFFTNHGTFDVETKANGSGTVQYEFADTVSIYVRTIYEGLFGIKLNMPDNSVTIKPTFPRDWNEASIDSPDVSYNYSYDGSNRENINITTKNAVNCNVKLTARTPNIEKVTVNGVETQYSIEKGVGVSYVAVDTSVGTEHNVEITYGGGNLPSVQANPIGAKNNEYTFTVNDGTIKEIYDPQSVIKEQSVNGSSCTVTLSDKDEYHTFFALVSNGEYETWQPIDIEMREPLEITGEEIQYNENSASVVYSIRNNTEKDITVDTVSEFVGEKSEKKSLAIAANSESEKLAVNIGNIDYMSVGSNRLSVSVSGGYSGEISKDVTDWSMSEKSDTVMDKYKTVETVNLDGYVNQSLGKLHTNTYNVLPRFYWSVLDRTVQKNGRSWWSDRKAPVSEIKDLAIDNVSEYITDNGIPFKISNTGGKNSVFVSQYENFPNEIAIDVNKSGNKMYFMLAVSTNPNQSRIENGYINVVFKDGTSKKVSLSDPENIDDWLGFQKGSPAYAQNGYIQKLNSEAHANVIDVTFDEVKEIEKIELKCLSNEMLIGLIGATVVSDGVTELINEADTLINDYEEADLSGIYSNTEFENLKQKCSALKSLIESGTYTQDDVATLYDALYSYKSSSNVVLTITPDESLIKLNTRISLNSSNSDVEIKYTTDGSEPDINSVTFTDEFTIKENSVVKYRGYYKGKPVTDVYSKDYELEQITAPNLALNNTGAKPIIGGGTGGGNDAALNDGNYSTIAYRDGTSGQYFGVNLGKLMDFNKVVVTVRASGSKSRITDAVLQTSNDGENWTDAAGQTPINTTETVSLGGADCYVSNIIFPSINAQYVRLLVKAGGNPQVAEFEVYNEIPTDPYTGLKIGDYVKMGKYEDQPIVWRVAAIDENNGPLLWSDKILCMKSFDGVGTEGSHSNSADRQKDGSDAWYDSNIRSWLQSRENAGEVTWLCGSAPTAENVGSKGVAYDDEKGFLHCDNFTDEEVSLIKSVEQKSILHSTADTNAPGFINGTANYATPSKWNDLLNGYDNAPYHMVTDTMFLLGADQLSEVYNNSHLLGEKYVIGTDRNGKSQFTWLRTRQSNYAAGGFVINGSFDANKVGYGNGVTNGNGGVRPAFYIERENTQITSGKGSEQEPYILSPIDVESKWSINSAVRNGNAVTVSVSGGNTNAVIVCAEYDVQSGVLINLSYADYENGKSEYDFEVDESTKVKVLVLSDFNSMTPLTKSENI